MPFTEEEVKQLSQSPYILNVTTNQINYGKIFFQEFWRITQLGYSAEEAFDFLGLDPTIVGEQRIWKTASRIKEMAEKGELYDDGTNSTLSIAEQLRQKDQEIKRLRQEVEFLKKSAKSIGSTRLNRL